MLILLRNNAVVEVKLLQKKPKEVLFLVRCFRVGLNVPTAPENKKLILNEQTQMFF